MNFVGETGGGTSARKAVARAVEAAEEAFTLEELSALFLPLLAEAVGADTTLLFTFRRRQGLVGLGGTLTTHLARYQTELFGLDPLQSSLTQLDPGLPTVTLDDACDPRLFRGSPAYHEFYVPQGIERLVAMWPTDVRYGSPGMVGLLLGRPRHEPDFSTQDRRLLEDCLPALRGVVRRDQRARRVEQQQDALRRLIDACGDKHTVAINANGELLWTSNDAEHLLAEHGTLLDELCGWLAARPQHLSRPPSAAQPVELSMGEASVVFVPHGLSSTAAVFAIAGVGPSHRRLDELARQHGLSHTQARVLECLARGLDNRSIASELHVSVATVKSHVRQVLLKLQVESRTQAALMAHAALSATRY